MELADLLRGSDATTVGTLAAQLEVSPRTVLRDLATLRERGMPITGEAGPGGGIRLERERGVAAVHLAVTEVVALWLAARLSREASDLPWGEAATSALSKLLASLPPAKASDMRVLCRRVIVGPPSSSTIRAGAGLPPPELLRIFEEAFSGGFGLAFHYRDREGRETNRKIEPHGLLVNTPVWYVLARDVEKGEPRMFRMDRIARPRVVRRIEFRPDFELIRSQIPEGPEWRSLAG